MIRHFSGSPLDGFHNHRRDALYKFAIAVKRELQRPRPDLDKIKTEQDRVISNIAGRDR
jgi:hypothetical protein